MKRRWLVVSVILCGACGDREPEPRVPAAELHGAAPSIAAAVLADHDRTCGAQTAPLRPLDLLVVTGRQCASCADVGYAARRIARDARSRGGSFAIAAPVGDSATVCRTLRRERTADAVVLVPNDVIPWQDRAAGLLFVRVPNGSEEKLRSIVAGNGVTLIDSLFPRAVAGTPHPSSGGPP